MLCRTCPAWRAAIVYRVYRDTQHNNKAPSSWPERILFKCTFRSRSTTAILTFLLLGVCVWVCKSAANGSTGWVLLGLEKGNFISHPFHFGYHLHRNILTSVAIWLLHVPKKAFRSSVLQPQQWGWEVAAPGSGKRFGTATSQNTGTECQCARRSSAEIFAFRLAGLALDL